MSARIVRCPICGREANWDDPPRGPFCSARCRLLDLGSWAGEAYRVAADPPEAAEEAAPSTSDETRS